MVAAFVGAGLVIGVTNGPTTMVCVAVLAGLVALDRTLRERSVATGILDVGPAIGSVAFFCGFDLGGLGGGLCLLALAVMASCAWSEWLRLQGVYADTRAAPVSEQSPQGAARRIRSMACLSPMWQPMA